MTTVPKAVSSTLEQAVETYTKPLYRHAYLLLGHPQDAQDVVQETFLRYMQKAPAFREAEHEKAWLLTVATNLCRNLYRSRRLHPHTGLEQLPEQGEETPADTMTSVLGQLPLPQRQVVVLHYLWGYKVREIAAMLHLTPSAVKMRLQKGRHLLEQYYKED